MKYMMLIYVDPIQAPRPDAPEFGPTMARYGALGEKMRADGVTFTGDPLHGIEAATAVRVRGGKVETMDGPFAETKEYLGGYYVIDVPDLDTALGYAAMIPAAEHGTVEVRPVMALGG